MKIGLVRRGYSTTGGAEAYLKRFARALGEAGHTSLLFASPEWPLADWPAGEIQRVEGKSPLAFADALEKKCPKTLCDFVFSLERVWQCDAYRAGDGVHRAWLERRRIVEPFWKNWLRIFNSKHRELLMLEKNLFAERGAGRVIANCEMVKHEIVAQYGYPSDKINVVYNGLPDFPEESLSKNNPTTREVMRNKLGLRETDCAILFAGSGWERKGLRAAIKGVALAQPSNTEPLLLIAGRGNPQRFPKSKRARFLGPVQNMPELYAATDLFLLPTIYDPFSNACLEALQAGLPVITTAANGFSEILTPGETGEILSDPTDASAIAKALEAWSDSIRRANIRPRLQQLAAPLTIEANVQKTLQVLGLAS